MRTAETAETIDLHQMTAVVLAGGLSSRMGQDKRFMLFDGQVLIQRIVSQLAPFFKEVLIGANDAGNFAALNLRVIPDEKPGQGPLMGLVSCLAASRCDVNFVTACDIPEIDIAFVRALAHETAGFEAVVPLSAEGRSEPLFAVYRKSVVAHGRVCLSQGRHRMTDLLEGIRVRYLSMAAADWYRNLNSREDYDEALRALGKGKRSFGA